MLVTAELEAGSDPKSSRFMRGILMSYYIEATVLRFMKLKITSKYYVNKLCVQYVSNNKLCYNNK